MVYKYELKVKINENSNYEEIVKEYKNFLSKYNASPIWNSQNESSRAYLFSDEALTKSNLEKSLGKEISIISFIKIE